MYNSTIWTSLLFSAQIFQLARTINLNFPIFTVQCPANIRGRMKCFGGYFQMKLAVRKLDKANQISVGYSVITTNISIRAEDIEVRNNSGIKDEICSCYSTTI